VVKLGRGEDVEGADDEDEGEDCNGVVEGGTCA